MKQNDWTQSVAGLDQEVVMLSKLDTGILVLMLFVGCLLTFYFALPNAG